MKWTLAAVLVLAACQSDPDNAVRRHHAPDPGDDDTSDDMPPAPKSRAPHMPDQNPDYPTPRRAGTDELFRIENPQRGPQISPIQAPDAKKLQKTEHARCEVDDAGIVCSRLPPPSKNDPGWIVGAKDGKPVLYQHLRNGHVDESYVLEYDGDGKLLRMTKNDAYGVLDWQRSYWPAGERYTARELDGGNELEGCGAIDVDVGSGGLADASTCLQWSGQPMKDTNGVSIEKWKRDDEGFVIEETHFDVGGMPIVGLRDAVHTITWTRDRWENPITERFADLGGKPAGSHDEHGCFGVDDEYAHDVLVKETCVDAGGTAVPRDDGIVMSAFDHDGAWCRTQTRYLDASGNPAGDEDGVASIKETVNAECDPTESTCRGLGGSAVACGPGKPAEYRITYDKQGRVIDEKYLNESGFDGADPNYGAPEIKTKYDALGRRLSLSCFSAGARSQCGMLGYHREESHWDDNGRETDEIYFNEDDTPASNIGIFQTKYTYDNYDHLAEEQGLDSKGQLYNADGMAVRRYYYDDGHRLFGMILLDPQNAPAQYTACFSELVCPENWQAVRIIRSPTGHVLSNEFFDFQGNLISTVDCRQETCWGED